ncbi:50S ribosome-binding GTPase [Yimella lutea]|uniref:50S ribosome-binding GTPase n=1 Tax=Yimella lutea TaxID=587872 RepID=A0A542EIX1_9MICO|nr:GTPase domain-containing protein [Yimella lutea]TQJ15291.1 50S ribosome-binding GTPase [Yimella lutea]
MPATPSRYEWMPSALPMLFGEEPEVSDPWPGLLNAVADFQGTVNEIEIQAVRDRAEAGLPPQVTRGDEPARPPTTDRSGDPTTPMRVVLMGRTMAGKSSLLAALTGSHFDRVGDGRQRFSRDVLAVTAAVSDAIEIVDTPGVGAYEGVDDTALALDAAREADVVLWVNSSDSVQEESAVALRQLGLIGKPIIVVLNCRQALEGVGRLNLLRFPERVFGQKDALVVEIEAHLAQASVRALGVVYVHALAAEAALADPEARVELHAASRINDLTDALLQEQRAHSESRRALRLVDAQRQGAAELERSLGSDMATLRAQAEHDRQKTADLHSRLRRVVHTAGEEMVADVKRAVGKRRDWHLQATDFGPTLEGEWKAELSTLKEEIEPLLKTRSAKLAADIRSATEAAESEWASVPLNDFGSIDLSDFGSVWGNRALRATVALVSVAVISAIGAVVAGPGGLAAGVKAAAITSTVATPVISIAASRLNDRINQTVLGKPEVLRRRRQQLAEKVGPILDQFSKAYVEAIGQSLGKLSDTLTDQQRRAESDAGALDDAAARLADHRNKLHATLTELDLQTTKALLRIAGRERLAHSVRRSTRVPGVCILTELTETGFHEAWLYPPDIGEKLSGGKAPPLRGEAASALSYTLSLIDAPVNLLEASAQSAHVHIDTDIPPAIAETWGDALATHIGKSVQITTTKKGAESHE